MPVPTTTRVRSATKERRRKQILASATELFSVHGYHHISMDDIAERIGTTKPVLYRHFPSKLDLYIAIIDACGDDLTAAVDAALAPARTRYPADVDGRDMVRAVVDAYVTFARNAGQTATLLFESDVMRDDGVRTHVLRPDAVNAEAITSVLIRVTAMPAAEAGVLGRVCTALARSAATEVARADAADVWPTWPDDPADLIAGVVSTFAWRGLGSFTPISS